MLDLFNCLYPSLIGIGMHFCNLLCLHYYVIYQYISYPVCNMSLITHSQREAYMDLVANSAGGGGRQEIEEPQGM